MKEILIKLGLLILLAISVWAYMDAVNASDREIIAIPSDYADYDFVDRTYYENTGQMRDESFIDFKYRQEYMEDDLRLNGVDLPEEEE